MSHQEELADLIDALDHIVRVCDGSREQSRRIRWIRHRAYCAINGGDWREVDLPKTVSVNYLCRKCRIENKEENSNEQ